MDKTGMVQALVEHYTEGNKAQFANMLGISAQTVSAWIARNTFDAELVYTKCRGVSASWLFTGEGDMLGRDNYDTTGERKPFGIPLLPVDAIAGVLSGNDMQVMEYDCEYFDVPTFKGAEFLMRVSGDSMQPKYYSGDIVACKRLPIDTFFQWNRVYVIGSEQGVILKRVRQGSDAEHITLVSENTDYAPFELPLNKVHSIALVVGVVRAE
ncbi:MAG: helix-turn-helix domain-containing protein [Tidjanibacter sp.]|nr:helix-turn-helix domain-containing protein [Tidjanibacter sp.]